jgi:prolyl oligopeptidase
VDLANPDRQTWRQLVPQTEHALEGAELEGGSLVLLYLRHATGLVRVVSLDGRDSRELQLPANSSVKLAPKSRRYFSAASFTQPEVIYDCGADGTTCKPLLEPALPFDANAFESRQVFYTSKDGTRVPMFLIHRRGLERSGNNPTLLYGYGGFNVSITPSFSPRFLGFLEMGGMVAVANLRGGGEYGEDWHKAGMKQSKQNVFDDFIAAAEYLIAEKYTSNKRLAIHGGSNGGLLVGAVMNQRPDLFAAAVPAVGVMDMLRFHKFTIGHAWTSDYGSPDDPEDFRILRRYSPLHNIRQGGSYPATLITTADHDDRVVPGHSFKYAAELQRAQGGSAPILIRIETSAGHGAGKPTSKRIEEDADVLTFLANTLGMKQAPAASR